MDNWKDEHKKDILSREWKYDFASLSNKELTFLLTNLFYQYFLIDVHSISIQSMQDRSGNDVEIIINGEAFRDVAGIDGSELTNIHSKIEEEEVDEDYDEEEDD